MEYTVGGLAEKLRGLHKVRVQKMWDDDQTQVLNKTAKCFKIRLKIYKEPVANDNTKITN